MFRLRMNDVEYTSKYVADFCDRNFTVGYRDKVDSYPYTWDFTDIQGFSSSKMDAEADNYPIVAAANDAYGYEWDISLFDANGNMKVNTGYDPITNNLIFSPHKIGYGNQLWAGGNVIPETRGLWFYSEDDSETGYSSEYSSALYNDCLQITSDGIRFANVPDQAGKRVAWWNYKMVVPDVPADGAVYLRMKRDTSVPDEAKTFSTIDNADVPFLAARFQFASQNSKTDMVKAGELKNGANYSFYKVPNTTDEYIVAVKNTTGNVNHLTFTLNGWIVKKVAVSRDSKAVNIKGYATESRDHIIDHSLTKYLTGADVRAYAVSNPNYVDRTLMLTDVAVAENYVLPESTGCVLYNAADTELKVLDNKFHLFVPDMHDQEKLYTGTNILVPNVATEGLQLSMFDGNYTNYVLTYKYQQLKPDGTPYGEVNDQGPEIFYRVSKNGIKLHKNSAYLQLPTNEVKPKDGNSHAKFTFVFADEIEEEEGTVTAIEEIVNALDSADEVWYNLNGQKLNGRPTKSGLYILNGHKVVVK